jgi:hypothetical protein
MAARCVVRPASRLLIAAVVVIIELVAAREMAIAAKRMIGLWYMGPNCNREWALSVPNHMNRVHSVDKGCADLAATLEAIADLAKIPTIEPLPWHATTAARFYYRCRFCNDVAELVAEYVKNPNIGAAAVIPVSEIAAELEGFEADARKLHDRLDGMKSRGTESARSLAGLFLKSEMPKNAKFTEYLLILDGLASWAKAAMRQLPPPREACRPRGTSGNRGLDSFVDRLLQYTGINYGKLTIYKSDSVDGGWSGSLLKALKMLKPHLSKEGPLPNKLSGKVLKRIHDQYRGSPVGKYIAGRADPSVRPTKASLPPKKAARSIARK